MSDHVHDCGICKVGYWECDDPDCGLDQNAPCAGCLRAENAALRARVAALEESEGKGCEEIAVLFGENSELRARLAAAESACRECVQYVKEIEGWHMDGALIDVVARLEPVLAGEGEAK